MKKGFTLIEIIIALIIITTASGFGIANYVRFHNDQMLKETGKTFVNNLRYAQKKALAGEKDTQKCVVGTTSLPLNGWCLSPQAGGSQYKIYGSCGPKANLKTFPTIGDITVDLPPNIKLRTTTKTLFQPLGQGPLFPGSPPPVQIEYCLENITAGVTTNQFYKVTLTNNNEIKDDGITSTCP